MKNTRKRQTYKISSLSVSLCLPPSLSLTHKYKSTQTHTSILFLFYFLYSPLLLLFTCKNAEGLTFNRKPLWNDMMVLLVNRLGQQPRSARDVSAMLSRLPVTFESECAERIEPGLTACVQSYVKDLKPEDSEDLLALFETGYLSAKVCGPIAAQLSAFPAIQRDRERLERVGNFLDVSQGDARKTLQDMTNRRNEEERTSGYLVLLRATRNAKSPEQVEKTFAFLAKKWERENINVVSQVRNVCLKSPKMN